MTAADGAVQTLDAKNIVIATGSEPTPLPGVAFEDGKVIDSTGALSLPAVPNKLIVVGAGIIGLELGSVWRRLGAEVTVVEFLDRITPGMDTEVATAFQRTLTKQGMVFKLGAKVTAAKSGKDGVELTVEPSAGGAAETLKGDVVLIAIGRRPYTDGLGLESVGVTPDKRGFIDHDHFKVADGVWVIGDVTHGPMLAHKAEEDAVAVIDTIAGKYGHVDYALVPSVVYTFPEVAWVGQTEDQLKAAGVAYKKGKFPFAANSRAKIKPRDRRLRKGSGRCGDGQGAGRPHHGPAGRRNDPRGRHHHELRRRVGRHRPHLPRPPDPFGSRPPGGHGCRRLDDAGLILMIPPRLGGGGGPRSGGGGERISATDARFAVAA